MTKWTRDTPWRQGHLLPRQMLLDHKIFPESELDTALAIIATHDCDLTQSIELEPLVEIILGHKIATLDGNYTWTKNARTLHIELHGNTPLFAAFYSGTKISIEKAKLTEYSPQTNLQLSVQGKSTLQRWLTLRYRRAAFPDEFERRLKDKQFKLAEKISKALKPHGPHITAMFFDVDEGQDVSRNGSDDIYILDIVLLHPIEPAYEEARIAAELAKSNIEQAFRAALFNTENNSWQQIELRYIDVLSEDALTYRQSTLFKQWRMDHISLEPKPNQPLLQD